MLTNVDEYVATKDDKIDLITHMDKRFRQSVVVLLPQWFC